MQRAPSQLPGSDSWCSPSSAEYRGSLSLTPSSDWPVLPGALTLGGPWEYQGPTWLALDLCPLQRLDEKAGAPHRCRGWPEGRGAEWRSRLCVPTGASRELAPGPAQAALSWYGFLGCRARPALLGEAVGGQPMRWLHEFSMEIEPGEV